MVVLEEAEEILLKLNIKPLLPEGDAASLSAGAPLLAETAARAAAAAVVATETLRPATTTRPQTSTPGTAPSSAAETTRRWFHAIDRAIVPGQDQQQHSAHETDGVHTTEPRLVAEGTVAGAHPGPVAVVRAAAAREDLLEDVLHLQVVLLGDKLGYKGCGGCEGGATVARGAGGVAEGVGVPAVLGVVREAGEAHEAAEAAVAARVAVAREAGRVRVGALEVLVPEAAHVPAALGRHLPQTALPPRGAQAHAAPDRRAAARPPLLPQRGRALLHPAHVLAPQLVVDTQARSSQSFPSFDYLLPPESGDPGRLGEGLQVAPLRVRAPEGVPRAARAPGEEAREVAGRAAADGEGAGHALARAEAERAARVRPLPAAPQARARVPAVGGPAAPATKVSGG
ncbi:hypothetical protein FIBSPDRAFT_998299 [Athelia psychrophila]|uniref:Uncharacterized protein n=1 Tax=Athelia psychrophila TaxID=1759441 RepID=A0A167XNR3_9AGAM|nr:hypothetical protein FIBSPDRAFT_998299 [Fibularhizoctonia sp. CBS 109695]